MYITCSHVIGVSSGISQGFVVVGLNFVEQEIVTSIETADVKQAVRGEGGQENVEGFFRFLYTSTRH